MRLSHLTLLALLSTSSCFLANAQASDTIKGNLQFNHGFTSVSPAANQTSCSTLVPGDTANNKSSPESTGAAVVTTVSQARASGQTIPDDLKLDIGLLRSVTQTDRINAMSAKIREAQNTAQMEAQSLVANSQTEQDSIKWGINPEFNPGKIVYDKIVPLPNPRAISQGSLGTCHLYCYLATMEQDYYQRTGKHLYLSPHFTAFMDFYINARQSLSLSSPEINIDHGGLFGKDHRRIIALGVIPDSAWNLATGQNRNFESAKIAELMDEQLRNIVANFKAEAASIAKESPEKIVDLQKKYEQLIWQGMENYFGRLPTEFVYENKLYSPLSFYREIFPEMAKQPNVLTFIADEDGVVAREDETTLGATEIFVTTSVNTMIKIIKERIDQGLSTWIGYAADMVHFDSRSSTLDLNVIVGPKEAKPLGRVFRQKVGLEDGGHAIQIVGYKLDPITQEVSDLLFRNSWGPEFGNGGFGNMARNYADTYIQMIPFVNFGDQTYPGHVPEKPTVRPKDQYKKYAERQLRKRSQRARSLYQSITPKKVTAKKAPTPADSATTSAATNAATEASEATTKAK